MQQHNHLPWGDMSSPINDALHIKHHSMLYSRVNRENPLSGLSTYEIEAKTSSGKNETVLEDTLA